MKKITALALIAILLLAVGFGCGGKPNLSKLSAQELFTLGKAKYDNKKYVSSIDYFQTLVYNYPGESIVDTAQYYLALSYYGEKEYELAQVEFNRLVVNYPSSTYFEHALFMKAVSFYEGTPKHFGLDQTDLYTAIRQFEDFIIDYPESVLVEDCKKYLNIAHTRLAHKFYNSAEVYERIGTFKSAQIYYQKVIDDYIDTEYAAPSTFGVGNMLFRQRKFDEAKTKLNDFITVFPESELVPKAHELLEKAAYLEAEDAYNKAEYEKAAKLLTAFIAQYPENDKVKDANKYLLKIGNLKDSPKPDENNASQEG